MEGFLITVFVLAMIGLILYRNVFSADAQARYAADQAQQAKIMCPHCGTTGTVTRQTVTRKQGISGGKATGAVMTGGASMFVTGLSRKAQVTQHHCSNCGTTWDVAGS